MNLPKFLFVGTAKAGTTSIYEYLKQHDEIVIPKKETFYFIRDSMAENHLPYPQQRPKKELVLTEKEYFSHYEKIDTSKIAGEIGTGYLYYYEESARRIKETLGTDVKICIMLRNPADRCFSSYLHFVKDLHETCTFEVALSSEKSRIDAEWDFMWHHSAMGFYANQVAHFTDIFPNVKIWLYDDFRVRPIEIMDEIIEFIGASPKTDWKIEKIFNPSGQPKNKSLQKFITHENPIKSLLRPLFRLVLSNEKREKIRKNAKNRNIKKGLQMTHEENLHLLEIYKSDIIRLEKILNRSLESWLKAPNQV